MSDTAHLLNSPTASFSKTLPHSIWHPTSSSLPLQELMQITLARQLGFRMHLARGTRHLLRRHRPIAAPSAALAGDGWNGPVKGRDENESVSARSAAVVALPACSNKLLFWSLYAFSWIRFCREWVDGRGGVNDVLSGDVDAATKRSSDFFMIIVGSN